MKKKNKIAVFAVMLMIISTFFTACEEISSAPVITEPADTNYPVSIGSLEFETAPQSVVSLSPAITKLFLNLVTTIHLSEWVSIVIFQSKL